MHQRQFWQWAEEKQLIKFINKNFHHFERLFTDCLGYNKEEILIIGDYGIGSNLIAPVMAGCFLKAAQGKKVGLVMQPVKSKNQKADNEVIEALEKFPEQSIIIMCLSNMLGKLGHLGKSYRRFCRLRRHKFASTTGIGSLDLDQLDKVVRAIDADYVSLRAEGQRVKGFLDKAREIKVKTKAGTDLTFNVEGMHASTSTGLYNEPGMGGNIPTGEVFIPPKMRGVEGKLVVDVSVRHRDGTLKIREEPLVVTIKEGRVVRLEGAGAELVEETLAEAEKKAKYPERIHLIGELGIGINPRAETVGSTIMDEKVKGTAHVAIGSNYWFGGQVRTIIHLDQVFKNPEIYLDGEKLNL